ncbi:Cation-independent mannose-6-phosphate receptor [Camponotus japonicus]
MSKFNGLLFLYSLWAVITSALTVTSFCEVSEHKLSIVYNLTKLSSNKEDIIIKHDYPNEMIRMQLCSPLIKKCNNQDGYAICLIKNNTEKGIGKYPPEVGNKDGRILFNFTGDNCLLHIKYTVQIIMQCDYSAESNSYPELFPHADKQCNLFMLWKTALACGPKFQTNCTVVNNDSYYDLSPLTRFSDNYVIHTRDEMKSPKIVLNVCHSIIRQYGAMCPIKSGACLDDPENHNRYSSLGEVKESPSFKNGYLQIEYQDGTLCYENIKVSHVKTTIRFICLLEATETIPEYVGGRNDCHYQLVWYTAAACSIESLRNYSVKTAGICSVTNPITNFTYNFQPLMNKDFTVVNASSIKLRVCGGLTDGTCIAGTGICNSKYNISLGQADTKLKWQQDGPYLKYFNGSSCENGMYHYTIIKFFCRPEGSSNQPILMEEHPCQTIIHWNTDLACEKKIKCTTNNDNEINLTPLIRSTSNYIVKANGTEFHINICRPLVPIQQSLACPYGSAACKVSVTSKNEYTNEISLGFPEDSPTLNKDLQTVLRYIGGSQCPEDPVTSISSNFTFVCDNNNQGLPVYKTYVNCTYVFEWHTSIACGAVIGVWTPPCIIKDSFLSYEYDLSLLHKKDQIHYVKGKQGKEYSINICGGEKYCNGSAVCHEGNGYGSLKSVIFDYSRDDVKLKYSNGSKCNNNSYTSEVRFLCNDSIGIGAPKLLLVSEIYSEFLLSNISRQKQTRNFSEITL